MKTNHWQELESLGYTREGEYVKTPDSRAIVWAEGSEQDARIRVQFAPSDEPVSLFELPLKLVECLT